jgi:hypothetical protein
MATKIGVIAIIYSGRGNMSGCCSNGRLWRSVSSGEVVKERVAGFE